MFTKSRMAALGAVATVLSAFILGLTPGGASAAAGAVSGTVYGWNDDPVAGATVTAYAPIYYDPACTNPIPRLSRWQPTASRAVTGSDGAFSVTVPDGTFRLRVTPPDPTENSFGYWVDNDHITPWVAFATDVTGGSSDLQIRLTKPGTVTGTVTDDTRRVRTVSGIDVRATLAGSAPNENFEFSPLWDMSGPDYASTTTSRTGAYVLTGLPTDRPSGRVPDPDAETPDVNESLVYGLIVVDPTGRHAFWNWWFGYLDAQQGGFNRTPVLDFARQAAIQDDVLVEENVLLRTSPVLKVHVTDAQTGRPVAGMQVMPDTAPQAPYMVTDALGNVYVGGNSSPGTVGVTDPFGPGKSPADTYRTTWYGNKPSYDLAKRFTFTSSFTAKIAVSRHSGTITGSVTDGTQGIGGQLEDWVMAFRQSDFSDPNDWSRQVGYPVGPTCTGSFAITGLWPDTYIVSAQAHQMPGQESGIAVEADEVTQTTISVGF